MPAEPSTEAPKRKRTRTGCLVCRRRKHKCDMERHPAPDGTFSCGRCLKGGKTCLWPVQEPLEARFAPYPATAAAAAPSAPAAASASTSHHQPPQPAPLVAAPPPVLFQSVPPSPLVPALPHDHWLAGLLPDAAPVPGNGQHLAHAHAPPPLSPLSSFSWPSPLQAFAQGLDPGPPFDLASWSPGLAAEPPLAGATAPTAPGGPSSWPSMTLDSGLRPSAHDEALPTELLDLIGSQVQPWQPQPPQQQQQAWSLDAARSPLYAAPTSTLVQMWPDAEERNLIQHFLMMVPASFSQTPRSTFGGQYGPKPPLARVGLSVQTFFPFLDIPAFLNTPRGSSTASEALALACMSIGAIHLQFLHQASRAQPSVAAQDRYGKLAASLVDSSLALGHTSLLLSPLSGSASPAAGRRKEDLSHLLAACSATALTKCFSGGLGYDTAINLAKKVVGALGGPAAMLRAEAAGEGLLFPDATRRSSVKKRLRIVRSLLEDLAGWSMCIELSVAAGDRLVSLDDGPALSDGASDWLFRYGPSAGAPDYASGVLDEQEDWDTLTFTMMMSRITFDLCGRVLKLHSLARTNPRPATPDGSPSVVRQAEDLLLEVRIRKRDVLMDHPDLALDDAGGATLIGNGGGAACSSLEFSNLEWALAMEIFIRVEVLGESGRSPTVQALAKHLVRVSDQRVERGANDFGSAWPLVIAGTMLHGASERATAKRVLMSLSCPICFDMNGYFALILAEVWEAHDAGREDVTWRDVPAARAGLLLF